MQIDNIELKEEHKGKRVRYFPPHIKFKDTANPQIQTGIIHSWNENYVFVKFPISESAQACYAERLKWK